MFLLSLFSIILASISIVLSIVLSIFVGTKYKVFKGVKLLNGNLHNFEIDLTSSCNRHYNYTCFCNEAIKIANKYGCSLSNYKIEDIYHTVTFTLVCDSNQLACFIGDIYSIFPHAEILKY